MATQSQTELNAAVVRRFIQSQGTPDHQTAIQEIMAPDYKRLRCGMANLAANAVGQDFPEPGAFLRTAIPDRVDVIEDIIAEEDRVGMLWRLTGTHQGNLFGIPPTGRKIDIYVFGIFRLAGGRIQEGWFMADELGLLIQLGVQMPPRKDGSRIAPPLTGEGETGDTLVERLMARQPHTREDRNRIMVVGWKSKYKNKQNKANYEQTRWGSQHLRDWGFANGVGEFDPDYAFPGREDRIKAVIAAGDKVLMQFSLYGDNTQSFYGLPPTGRRCEMLEVSISRFDGDTWVEGWCLADALGMMLQLDALELLEKLGCKPATLA